MPRLLAPPALLLVLALAGLASAQDRDLYRPWIDEALFARADGIVVGRLGRSVRLNNGETIDRFEVAETLSGKRREHLLLAAAPAALRAHAELPKLVFYTAAGDAAVAGALDVVDLPGDDGRARVALVRSLLAAAREPHARDRARGVERAVLAGATEPSAWCRRVLVRELDRLVTLRPGDFDGGDALALEAFVATGLPAEESRLLRLARARVDEAAAVRWTAERLVFDDEEKRRSFLRDLTAFQRGGDTAARIDFLDRALRTFGKKAAPLLVRTLDDDDPALRTLAARRLGDLGAEAGNARLLAISRDARAPRTLRLEALSALAMIAPLDCEEHLRGLAGDDEIGRAALRTIAAINTGEARLWLEDRLARLEKEAESDPAALAHLRGLLDEAFRAELQAERRRRRAELDDARPR